jgi:HNH endonuclease
VSKFGLSNLEAAEIKRSVTRTPIEEGLVDLLLERSNFTCNICKGQKSHGYIVHHIVPYEESQDNTYNNLVVLCPACHDLAHRSGLTLTITDKQLRKAKSAWEKEVLTANVNRAAQLIQVADDAIDYVNIRRIEERCVRLFKTIPDTTVSSVLKRRRILGLDGGFDQKYVQKHLSGGSYLFDYMNSHESEHYRQLLERIAAVTDFVDFTTAVGKGYAGLKPLEGCYGYFIGGVFGKSPRIPITRETPEVRLYYRTKKIYIEWVLDPRFLMSMSSIIRVGGKNRYIVYCLIRTVEFNQREGRTYVKASPLLIAQPKVYIDKTPEIALKREYERYKEEGWIEDEDV